ncbi:hypothetical protein GGQ20_001523 [Salinibacter ruber]|uniref:hypothetical protein n=1 Tax=Salinibacter ruber TaxID=146919 RepID=UPI002166E447|nr:hypothetical protein [Salinibacter ruber]MCS3700214.1 hypothetical protein [Salinibacter ruber]
MPSDPPHGSKTACQDNGLLFAALSLIACLFVACALGPVAAQAQVQVEQVGEDATPDVKGVSQPEVIVAQGEGAVGDVTTLIPEGAPDLTPTDGNSASVFQDGSGNDARIRQVGTGNEASASQLGDNNETAIVQGGGSLPSDFGDGLPDGLSGTDVFEAIRTFRPGASGTGNRAVAVHSGNRNQTAIAQLGTDNVAGIRLDGSDNTMNLLQTGDENRFLMDTAARELDMNVLQNGNGNSLQTNVPVNARMNGNGIELVIRRGSGAPLPLGNGE